MLVGVEGVERAAVHLVAINRMLMAGLPSVLPIPAGEGEAVAREALCRPDVVLQ